MTRFDAWRVVWSARLAPGDVVALMAPNIPSTRWCFTVCCSRDAITTINGT